MAVFRFMLVTLFATLLAIALPAQAETIGAGPHILSTLVPETDTPASGAATTLAIVMTPQPGWHGYWKTPGDSGLPTLFHWSLPRGLTAGEARYPVPGTLLIAGLMNHVYEHPYALLVPLTVPAGLATGTRLPIALKLDYLVCTTSLCVPESASLATTLTVGDGRVGPATAARFDLWRRALPRPLGGTAQFQRAGGTLRIGVPLPAAVALDRPHLFGETDGALAPAAPQSFARDGDRLVIDTTAGPSLGTGFDAVLATGGGAGLSFHARPGPVAPAAAGSNHAGTIATVALAFLGAVLGGLILNVMPCVFPILSLKALSLARAGGEERQVRREALAYAAGVILVCVALGGLILALRAAGSQVGWAFQLQDPRVILVLILLASAIGFNLAGLFELGAVSAGSELAGQGGVAGAFWTGALAAFVATPCTGPFMAGALGVALLLPVAAALLIFAGLGLGLALPFLLIGYLPALRRVLPRPGGWMETFRHVLAVPMFLTALGLADVLGSQAGRDGIVLGVAAAMLFAFGLWATGLRQRRFARAAWAPAIIGLLLALGTLTVLPRHGDATATAPDAQATSQRFDPARLAALRAAGTPVFLYFTADWCLSCKVNEKVAIERAETQDAFRKAGVVTMIGDWTDGDAAIGRFLEAHGRSGVPLYLWYAPGQEARELPQVLTPGLLSGLTTG